MIKCEVEIQELVSLGSHTDFAICDDKKQSQATEIKTPNSSFVSPVIHHHLLSKTPQVFTL
ncbi:hypothetical protein BHYA_0172g00160 [Botrytis hyacinthi]|uniref:Uncharacterized protein n=1 Tax=Botrytis hyacinthi TaxID=278943 RepID=A0A4Z1GML0_9HELO|nr:hypothetical protein BHYA_0172g00160 [Botrytis hyacinthi]